MVNKHKIYLSMKYMAHGEIDKNSVFIFYTISAEFVPILTIMSTAKLVKALKSIYVDEKKEK